jgi:hypothetical protein
MPSSTCHLIITTGPTYHVQYQHFSTFQSSTCHLSKKTDQSKYLIKLSPYINISVHAHPKESRYHKTVQYMTLRTLSRPHNMRSVHAFPQTVTLVNNSLVQAPSQSLTSL